ncbi:E3 ubiquitin- ligase TRIM13 isoform X1 [Pelobates cultripes]|uniref:E3 ubiquitin- ligase TRIM13 isoform X1 n=1 Tax=Pelobates cultripes TaxID=61616 RepID=A0AAD1R6M4_PELCU|nr:E3 ubiquitin- ligase TRIM13 isoform X1 [Pelobates cultripes]
MNVMEMLEEDLTCPVCCSLFEDPRVLPCSHSFCKKCLEGIIEGNSRNMLWRPSSLKCPTCRKETSTTGVNGYQANYLLKGIVEKYNKIKVSPKMPVCKVHSVQPLNMFCSTDLKLICGFCATSEEHKGHTFSSIDNAYNQEKSSVQSLLMQSENWHCDDVLSHLKTLETNKRKALHLLSMDSDKVKAYFEKLQHVLEQKKNEILSDFETMKLGVMQAYDPEINKLNALLKDQKKACDIAEDFKEISDPLLFLQQVQEFREKINIIKKAPLPSVSDVTVSPSMKNFDTSMWDTVKLADVDKLSLPPESPKKKYNIRTKFPFQVLLSIRVLLLCLVVAILFSGFFYDYHLNVHEYIDSGCSYLSTITRKATDHISALWNLTSKEVFDMSERCQTYFMAFIGHVAEFACKYKL